MSESTRQQVMESEKDFEQWQQRRSAYLARLLHGEFGARWPGGPRTLDTVFRHAMLPPGKLFRPMLLLESAAAVGGDVSKVLPAAVGAEAGHVASLIHDDIIDDDPVRRGKPSVQAAFGVSEAIVSGDSLLFALFGCLAECRSTGVPAENIVRALAVVAKAGQELCLGQSMEAELCAGYTCDVESYLTMIRLKTSSFFRSACVSGAVLGGGGEEALKALGDYGDNLGVAFQIFDDLLAYTSDNQTTGKTATSDIRNGRLTLPILLARELGGPAATAQIDGCLTQPSDDNIEETLAAMEKLLADTGAIAAAVETARGYAERAQADLLVLKPSRSREVLAGFAARTVDRFS
jgi:geranylgeranyl pyrophosphate synthase